MLYAVASLQLNLADQHKRSMDMDCPGDTLSYNCSIKSNTEELQLMWNITYPDNTQIAIMYDQYSTIGAINKLEKNITASLLRYNSLDGYIESWLNLTVLEVDKNIDGTTVECRIRDLDFEDDTLSIRIAGMYA
jgi:hypothetical protein